MAWKKLYSTRLLKLANHLEKGKLGHKKFDFSIYNSNDIDQNGCGSSGCAIGECPVAFPKHWEFSKNGTPVLRECLFGSPCHSGETFFGINEEEYEHLFTPAGQMTRMYGGKYLNPSATKIQVAKNIRAFVEKKSKRENQT